MPLLRATIVVLLAAVLAPDVAAQPATPQSVEACTVERREISDIVAILSGPPPASPRATPAHDHGEHAHATPARPAVEPVGTPRLLRPELPGGDPVDAETAAALTATMQHYLACANASDVIGLMSLVSNDFLRLSFGAGRLSEADVRAYAEHPQPVPVERRRRLVAVREGRRLADGRVVALVDTTPLTSANPDAVDTDLVTFVLVDGRYLIDRYVASVTVWYGPNASPTP